MYITLGLGPKPTKPYFDEALTCIMMIGAQLTQLDSHSEVGVTLPLPVRTSASDEQPNILHFVWGSRSCQFVFWQAPALLLDQARQPHLVVELPNIGAVRYETWSHGLRSAELTRLEADLRKSLRQTARTPDDAAGRQERRR